MPNFKVTTSNGNAYVTAEDAEAARQKVLLHDDMLDEGEQIISVVEVKESPLSMWARQMFAHKNEFAHRMLTDQGCFTHQHVEADFDDGDVESGPSHNSGYPAFDLYEGDSHDLVIDHTGLIADMVLIDWDTFRFFQEMQPTALETCARCGIAIRPEGGHICGSCGRDI